MAPSVAETVTTTVDQASNGIAKLNLKQDKPAESTKKDVSTTDTNLIIVNDQLLLHRKDHRTLTTTLTPT